MAGLMDAEGMFNIERAFRNDERNCYNYYAHIVLTNTNLNLIKWAVKHFGGVCKNRKLEPGLKQAFDWKINNQKHGLHFISLVYPHLIVKKKEAKTLLQYYALLGKECPAVREQLFMENKKLKWDKSSVTTDTSNISNSYAAGFIDGDGGIDSPHRLSAKNVCKAVIDSFISTYGGSYTFYESVDPNHNDVHYWYLSNPEKVKPIILSWLPYLIDKKDRAKNCLLALK